MDSVEGLGAEEAPDSVSGEALPHHRMWDEAGAENPGAAIWPATRIPEEAETPR